MKNGDVIELVVDTMFYKKGKRAVVVNSISDNKNDCEIRWVGEQYLGGDVDCYPRILFKVVDK